MTDDGRPAITSLRSAATFSGAKRWTNCPGSVSLALGLKEPTDEEWKTAGTEAHKVACLALDENTPLDDVSDEAVKVYVDYVRTMAGEGVFFVEKRLSGLGTSGGIDCYAIRGKLCHIFDFKYGVGVRLRAPDNEQLAGYAVLVKEHHPEITTIIVHLIQPRVKGIFDDVPSITSWTMPWQTIKMWRNDFEEALRRVETSNDIKAGPWCQFCLAQPRCPAYQAMVQRAQIEHKELFLPEIADEDDDEETESMELIPAQKLELSVPEVQRIAKLFSIRSYIEKWFKKADAFLLQQLQTGFVKPEEIGYEIGCKRSNRVWDPEQTPEEIAAELVVRGVPVEEVFETELLKITKAEELVQTDGLWVKPIGGPKLKPIKVAAPKKAKKKTAK